MEKNCGREFTGRDVKVKRYVLLDTRAFLAVLGISFLTGVLIGWGLAVWTLMVRGIYKSVF